MNNTPIRMLCLVSIVFFLNMLGVSANQSRADVYCGIYAIYGAASTLGPPLVDFESLVDSRFVGSRKGSSASELIAAGEELGVNVTAHWHLGASSLRTTESPLVLHFCSYGQLETYDHWVLFLGIKDGKAIVQDSGSSSAMSISEVLLRWDGVALSVQNKGQEPTMFSRNETSSFIPWVVLFASFCFFCSPI
jgi:hypothetical protein